MIIKTLTLLFILVLSQLVMANSNELSKVDIKLNFDANKICADCQASKDSCRNTWNYFTSFEKYYYSREIHRTDISYYKWQSKRLIENNENIFWCAGLGMILISMYIILAIGLLVVSVFMKPLRDNMNEHSFFSYNTSKLKLNIPIAHLIIILTLLLSLYIVLELKKIYTMVPQQMIDTEISY